jgi:hypothetical protein
MNLKYKPVYLAILSFLSISAFGQDGADKKVVWSCTTEYGSTNIVWLVEWGSKSYIKVFDERIPSTYSMSGLRKRWNWGYDDERDAYMYSLVLRPDLYALYYDFTVSKDGVAESKQVYKCSKG